MLVTSAKSPTRPAQHTRMKYFDSVQFLYSLGNEMRGAKLGLDRIQILLEALDHPERHGRIIHVAGTNGKGSTCAMIASGLQAAGLRTGLYTSPHLVEPTERIQIDGVPVDMQTFTEAFAVVHAAADRLLDSGQLDVHPSYFETVTLMAFLIFKDRKVDCSVYEVGLGGRLDATNVVMPELSVITPIDYDHEQFLGGSIESIATEKAGILKLGIPAIISHQRPEAMGVIEARAAALGVRLLHAGDCEPRNVQWSESGCSYQLDGLSISCPLAGLHQLENSVTAVKALRKLGIADSAIEAGIAATKWPGRLEQVSTSPRIILDGAHNPAGARALVAYIQQFFSGRKVAIIFGAMRDKSIDELATTLFPMAQQLILTAPNMPRALRPEALSEFVTGENVLICPTLAQAIAAIGDVDVTFITGSLYLVGEARAYFVQ